MERKMNFIEKRFGEIISTFEKESEEKLFKHMRDVFVTRVPIPVQESMQRFLTKYPFWGELNVKCQNFQIFQNKAKVFKQNVGDLVWLFDKLGDWRSKFVLLAVLENYFNFDFSTIQRAIEPVWNHYWDLDLLSMAKHDVIVDVGAYYGDSVTDFVRTFGQDGYGKIVCYEITEEVCKQLCENVKNFHDIEVRNLAVGDKNDKVYMVENLSSNSANQTAQSGENAVKMVTLDDDLSQKLDLIKMDIEGGEEKALLGCERHIKEEKPNLLVSVYHNNSDIFNLARLIYDMNQNYKFYLRYYGLNIYATEIVLFAL